jgi:hypothetical protein
MGTIKNYEIFHKGTPAQQLVDDADVRPEDILTEEELEAKDNPEKHIEDTRSAEVSEIPVDSNEAKRHVLTFGNFNYK